MKYIFEWFRGLNFENFAQGWVDFVCVMALWEPFQILFSEGLTSKKNVWVKV